jgi:hypothetical protein
VEAIAPVFFIALVVAFIVGMMVWHYSRANDILTGWARDNGYEIVASERRWFFRGPFFFWTGKGQEVYYVTVRTPDGQLHRGWVRCGGFWLGMLSDQADVRWDE